MKRSSPAPAPRHTDDPLGTLQTQPPAQRHEATTPFIPPATKIIITRHQPQICLPQNTGRRQTRAHRMATRRVHKRLHTTSRCSDCRTGCPQIAAQPLGFCPPRAFATCGPAWEAIWMAPTPCVHPSPRPGGQNERRCMQDFFDNSVPAVSLTARSTLWDPRMAALEDVLSLRRGSFFSSHDCNAYTLTLNT